MSPPTALTAPPAPALALAVLVIASHACGTSHQAETRTPGAAIAVTAIRATRSDVAESLEAGGIVTAGTSATISSRVVAPIIELRVRAGDRVRTGHVLVLLDDRDLAAHARQATAAVTAAEQGLTAAHTDLASAVAEQKLAVAWHKRIAALHERKSATTQELDEAEARLSHAAARAAGAQARIAQATSTIAAARAAADAAATTRSFATITAPFTGLVTETLTDPGNLATPGTPLLRMESSGAPRVELTVDESRATYVHVGDRVNVFLHAAPSDEGDSQTVAGTVLEVARAIAADQRAFTVKISLPPDHQARSGTYARVQFKGPVRRAVLVPTAAIRRQGQIATVFVVQGDTVRLRLLQTGHSGPEGVEVLAGLEAGEVVVTSPPADLAEGQRVRTNVNDMSGEHK